MEVGAGKTLCIPTIFISYTGESLDYKAPLLKALESLNNAAVDVCHYFDKNVTKVTSTLGWEQEYFLIDDALAAKEKGDQLAALFHSWRSNLIRVSAIGAR